MAETGFLSRGNHFHLSICSFCKWKSSLKLVQTHFLGKIFFSLLQTDFLSSGNCFLLFCAWTVSETKDVHILVETSWNKLSVLFINSCSRYLSKTKKQYQYGRVLKITVKNLTCITLCQLFKYNFTFKTTLSVFFSKVQKFLSIVNGNLLSQLRHCTKNEVFH